MNKLAQVRGFVMDMDGTIFLGETLLPGAVDFVTHLQKNKTPFLFLTNNSSKHRELYEQKLNRLGLNVTAAEIFTSGEATAIYLKEKFARFGIYLVGTPALETEFQQHGYFLTDQNPSAVVLGFDTTLTYEKLWKLCDFVRAGLPYFATHPDLNCPTENGYMPDIGAMIAFVEASTGRRPDQIIGKPNLPVVDALKERLRLPVEEICMIGDRLYTDIALGQAGLVTVLVLSGETKAIDVPESPFKPDITVDNLAGLYELLR
ncbi:MAG: HAD family hydrolase [Anaerolineaceae bacterium]|nr:HAD family hydrolase [Anaerolineaceae bacterium]